MYLNVNLEDKFAESFLSSAISAFYSQIEVLNGLIDFEDLFPRIGEKTFTDIFDKGLWSLYDREKLISLQQVWVKKENDKWGIPDLLVEFMKTTLFVFECKYWHADETEPSSESWKELETRNYYNKATAQAQSYLQETSFYSRFTTKYIVTLTFSPVVFTKKDTISKWLFGNLLKDEFYAFNHFIVKDKDYGLAVYGMVTKI